MSGEMNVHQQIASDERTDRQTDRETEMETASYVRRLRIGSVSVAAPVSGPVRVHNVD